MGLVLNPRRFMPAALWGDLFVSALKVESLKNSHVPLLALRGWYLEAVFSGGSSSIAPGLKNRGLRSAREARSGALRNIPNFGRRCHEFLAGRKNVTGTRVRPFE